MRLRTDANLQPVTIVGELTLTELKAIVDGWNLKILSDMDFFTTLAAYKCIIAPPYVVRLCGDGHADQLVRISYDRNFNLDKPRILLATLRALAMIDEDEATHIIRR